MTGSSPIQRNITEEEELHCFAKKNCGVVVRGIWFKNELNFHKGLGCQQSVPNQEISWSCETILT
jgi:hypothetical protein